MGSSRRSPVGGAAIPRVPAGVYGEVHQVRETANILRSGRRAPLQLSEGVQVHRIGSLGFQVSIQEIGMAHLIQRVACDVLHAVPIQIVKAV